MDHVEYLKDCAIPVWPPVFESFPKIPRWKGNGISITEKIDGTNAQIIIPEDDGPIVCGSRNRYITPEQDNAGFARWVKEHETEIRALGPGRHFGEWWGKGIQRGYDQTEKRFSLFNVSRWKDRDQMVNPPFPACVSLVPELYCGEFSNYIVEQILDQLRTNGSSAAPGFMRPEGVIIFHFAGHHLYKYTLEGDKK